MEPASIPGFNQWLRNCFDICNVVSGRVVCALLSMFVTGSTVESVSVFIARVNLALVRYIKITFFWILMATNLGTNICAKQRCVITITTI